MNNHYEDNKKLVELVTADNFFGENHKISKNLNHMQILLKNGVCVIRQSLKSPARKVFVNSIIINLKLQTNIFMAAYYAGNLLYTSVNGVEQKVEFFKIDILFSKSKVAIQINGNELGKIILTDNTTDIAGWCQIYVSDEEGDVLLSYMPAIKLARKIVFVSEGKDKQVKALMRQMAQIFLMGKGCDKNEPR